MRKALSFASLLTIAALVACGGGGSSVKPIVPSTPNASGAGPATSTVSVLVVVPSGTQTTSTKRHPAFTAPGGTQSLSISLTSVNGSASNGTPTVFALSGTNCEAGNNEELCTVSFSAPVGVLLYTVDTFTSTDGSGTPSGAGVFQVQTTAGQTTTVSTALSGTVAKIEVLLNGTAELGSTASVQVFVNGLDANGNTILGSYTSSVNVTLSDTDASGQTSLSGTSLTLYGSSATSSISLDYLGGAMTTAAVIGASATGISGANVTPATFLPDTNAPTVNGATTNFAYSETSSYGYNGPATSPEPTETGVYTTTVATGQSFNGQNNLVAVSGLQFPTAGSSVSYYYDDEYLDSNSVTYFAWTPQGSITSLGYVGVSDPGFEGVGASITCAAPYSNQLELPFPSSWNVLSGSGACTYSYQDSSFTETTVVQSDGSYNDSGQTEYCCPTFVAYSDISQSNGSAVISQPGDCIMASIPAPSPGASTVPVTVSAYYGGAIAPVPSPTPYVTSAPNPWLAYAQLGAPGLANGTPPVPLESDTFATVGTIAALPAGCAVPSTVLGETPSLNEADETIVTADPMSSLNPGYTTATIKHYYLNGVGEICNENTTNYWYMDDAPPFEGYPALEWYVYGEYDIATYTSTQWTYVTQSSLTATYAHVRDFTQALPATSQAFTAASYALIHARHALPTRFAHSAQARFQKFTSTSNRSVR